MRHKNHRVSSIENQQSRIQYRESSYLRAYKAPDVYVPIRPYIYVPIRHYICREPSTNHLLFMQNKPNSPNVQFYINIYDTKYYKNFIPLAGQKNKPNSNPIKPNCQKAKMNVNLTLTKDYRKKDDFIVRINKPNLVRRRRIPK